MSTPHHVRFPRRSPLRLRERGLAVFMHPAASQGGGKRALNAHVAVTGALLPDLSLLARPDRSPSRIAVSPFVVRPGYACGGALSRHRRGYAGSLRRAERARRKGTRAVARAWGFACTPKERCVSTSPADPPSLRLYPALWLRGLAGGVPHSFLDGSTIPCMSDYRAGFRARNAVPPREPVDA